MYQRPEASEIWWALSFITRKGGGRRGDEAREIEKEMERGKRRTKREEDRMQKDEEENDSLKSEAKPKHYHAI